MMSATDRPGPSRAWKKAVRGDVHVPKVTHELRLQSHGHTEHQIRDFEIADRWGKDIVDQSAMVCQHVSRKGEQALLGYSTVGLVREWPEA